MRPFIVLFLMAVLTLFWACDRSDTLEPVHEKYFVKYYGKDGAQRAVDMVINTDGSITILGQTNDTNGQNLVLLKVNGKGEQLWFKVFGNGRENPTDLEITNDGNYVVVSNIGLQEGSGPFDIKVLRFNPEGVKIDSTIVPRPIPSTGGTAIETWYARSVTPLSDGGFLLTGNSTDPRAAVDQNLTIPDLEDIVNILLEPNLSLRYTRLIGEQGAGAGVRGFQERNYYYIFGYSDALSSNDDRYEFNNWFLRLNETFVESGTFTEGHPIHEEIMQDAVQVPNTLGGGYITVGTQRQSNGTTSCYITKFIQDLKFDGRGDGNVAFQATLSSLSASAGQLSGVSIAPVVFSTPGYLVLANENTVGEDVDIYLTKIDPVGALVKGWVKVFGSVRRELGASVKELPDGRIAVLGTFDLVTKNKIGLILLNPNGDFTDF